MALADKDILITTNIGQTADPKIEFKGADAILGPQTISLNVYPTSNGTLSFEGSAGQLFSITNDLTGSIFSVNDVSGIPSIEVNADGTVKLAEFSGNVGIGTSSPVHKLSVVGTGNFTGAVTFNSGYIEKVTTIGSIATSTYNLDTSTANIFDITLEANVTITFTNAPAAGLSHVNTLIVRQPSTSPGRTLTVTGAIYTDGTLPILSTGANQIDVLTFWSIDGGTVYFGTFAMANVS